MSIAMLPHSNGSETPMRERPTTNHAVVSEISEALRRTGYGQLRTLELRCDDDAITLAGRVPTYFLKQMAQVTARNVPGVSCVRDEIQVVGELWQLA